MKFSLKIKREDSYKVLGQVVKYNRALQGYSLRDLGSLANISHTLIANIEKGRVVSSKETLEDLFNVLKLNYYDSDELIEEFVPMYNTAFNHLYNYEYDSAMDIIDELMEKESVYQNSIVSGDYFLLKYLYLALLDSIYGEEDIVFNAFLVVEDYLSMKQKQILYLIHGIYYFYRDRFKEANIELNKALRIGNSDLDPLVKTYLVKSNVRMFAFMDGFKIGNKTIVILEEELNYLRAMEIRLSIAYAYIEVRKFDDALFLLRKGNRFAIEYKAKFIIGECNLLFSTVAFMKGDLVEARRTIELLNRPDALVYFARVQIAIGEKNMDQALLEYRNFSVYNEKRQSKDDKYIFETILCRYKMLEISDKVYLKRLNEMIESGIAGNNMNLIEFAYTNIVFYYKERRMYKKALDASEIARTYRKYGSNI